MNIINIRTNRPTAAFDKTSALVVTKNEKDKVYHFNGIADSMVVWPIHDGTSNQFEAAPSYVKKTFKSVGDIRTFMSVPTSSKVFAIVLSKYKSKGVHSYEISNPKFRSGFGKCDITFVPPAATKAADIQKMFGGTSSQPSQGPSHTPSDPTTTHSNDLKPVESDSFSGVTEQAHHSAGGGDGDVQQSEPMTVTSVVAQ